MSGQKGFDTKVPDDINVDSGFLSGPIDRLPEGFEDESASNVHCESEEPVDLDSGLDLCLSSRLDSLELSPAPPPPRVTVTEAGDIPPLAILFQQDEDGDTQLHIAAVHGCQRSVSTLIRVCPDKYWLDLPNDFGHTALHLAVMSGHAVVTRMLIQAGASVDIRDLNGDTALHIATRSKDVQCLQALLAPVSKQTDMKKLAPVLNLKNYDGQTCVHLAATAGHVQTLQTLVYYGADVNAREGLAGWTALHIAARRGDARLAAHLLERCAGVAARARDYAGRTPRRLARKHPAFNKLHKHFKAEDSDDETASEDEYEEDVEDEESLFAKIKGSMTPVVSTN